MEIVREFGKYTVVVSKLTILGHCPCKYIQYINLKLLLSFRPLPLADCFLKNRLSCLEKNFFMTVHCTSFSLLTISNKQMLKIKYKKVLAS